MPPLIRSMQECFQPSIQITIQDGEMRYQSEAVGTGLGGVAQRMTL